MEPLNQFEKEFKNKLDAREIAPSAAAWDRLDAMLAVAEQKKQKRGFGWLYIAASILGFLTIGAVFFSQTETVVDQPRAVAIEEAAPQTSARVVPEAENATALASVQSPGVKKSKSDKRTIINQNQTLINQNPVEAVAQIPDQDPIASTNQSPLIAGAVKVDEDELLAAVQSGQATPRTSVKVNARNLLHEVDKNVNLSFREKMLRRASEVAEAVVTRNIE